MKTIDKSVLVKFLVWYSWHFETHSNTHAYCHNKLDLYFVQGEIYLFEDIVDFWIKKNKSEP